MFVVWAMAAIIVGMLLLGCASPVALRSISGTKSMVLDSDANRRAAYILQQTDPATQEQKSVIVAEPPPDTALNLTATIAAQLSAKDLGDPQLQAQLAQTVTQLTQRTQAVVILRDSLFRLAEARANGFIDNDKWDAGFREVMTSVNSIAAYEKKTIEELKAELRTVQAELSREKDEIKIVRRDKEDLLEQKNDLIRQKDIISKDLSDLSQVINASADQKVARLEKSLQEKTDELAAAVVKEKEAISAIQLSESRLVMLQAQVDAHLKNLTALSNSNANLTAQVSSQSASAQKIVQDLDALINKQQDQAAKDEIAAIRNQIVQIARQTPNVNTQN
jgi:DNA repair exonuclease SbcCD ATPase subunit